MKRTFRLPKDTKGFTLIELVIYVGILGLLLGVMSSIFSAIVDVQLESTSTSGVNQDGRYLLSKLLYDLKNSSAILVPANPGTQSSTMQLTINSINYTYSVNSGGNLQVVNNSTSETNVLNSYDTSVSGLTFTRVGNGGTSDDVRVTYTLTSRTTERAKQHETKTFTTTLGTQ
ncbi:MAG TPA: prepilin-type N-terminal cleavage/methylation domain-containing protein [Candidatus Saccharimonadales bacterium]|nr:prepilin-type N-terminal cleavage/methylation domain-containing protein [Candidatus Saccharimonadales bacterium]